MSVPLIVAISNDLMATAPIENAARQAGATCKVVAPAAAADCSESPHLVLLDLSATSEVGPLVATLLQQFASAPIVAFGPHVHADKLKAASEAGCQQVLTRGQFHQQVVPLVASYMAS